MRYIVIILLFFFSCSSRKVDKQRSSIDTKLELTESIDSLAITKLSEIKEIVTNKVTISENELINSSIKYIGKPGDEMKVNFNEETKELTFSGSGRIELKSKTSRGQLTDRIQTTQIQSVDKHDYNSQSMDKTQTSENKSDVLNKKTERKSFNTLNVLLIVVLLVAGGFIVWRLKKN